MRTAPLYTLPSFLAIASAQASNGGEPDVVFGAPTTAMDNSTLSRMERAIRNPNATRSVEFTPFKGEDLPGFGNSTWTWRVNISDFLISDSEFVLNNTPGGGTNIVATSYDLSWPGGGNISAETSGGGSNDSRPLCATSVVAQFYAANVTNAFTEDDSDNTSCAPALGEACVYALLGQEIATEDGCVRPDLWSRIPECYSSFGYTADELDNPTWVATQNLTSGGDAEYASGERFMTYATQPFDPEGDEDEDTYERSARRLQLLLLQTTDGQGSRASELLCMRVDLDDDEDESAGQPLRDTLGSASLVVMATAAAFFIMA